MEQPLIGTYQSLGEPEPGTLAAELSLADLPTDTEPTAQHDFTTEDVIESMPWGRFQVFFLSICGLFAVVRTLEVLLLTVLFPALQCEWQLGSLQSAALTMLFFTGMLCGAPLWGLLSDKYGRKPITFFSSALVAYFGLLSAFSPTTIALISLQFLVGVATSGNIPMAVLRAELIGSKYRAVTVVTSQLMVIWVTNTACYYGTSIAATELISIDYCAAPATNATNSADCGCSPLTSSDYGHVALTSVSELLIMPIVIILVDRIGRRNCMALCQALSTLPYLLLLTCIGSTWGVTILLFLARSFTASITTITYLYTPEVYPTQCRAVALSCCFIASRIGAILAPVFSQVLLHASVHLTLAIYAAISALGALASFFLPIETKGRKMD